MVVFLAWLSHPVGITAASSGPSSSPWEGVCIAAWSWVRPTPPFPGVVQPSLSSACVCKSRANQGFSKKLHRAMARILPPLSSSSALSSLPHSPPHPTAPAISLSITEHSLCFPLSLWKNCLISDFCCWFHFALRCHFGLREGRQLASKKEHKGRFVMLVMFLSSTQASSLGTV